MQLVRYNPFQELQKMGRDMDSFWNNNWNILPTLSDASTMDLYEEDGNLVAEVSLPHFKKEEINVTTDENTLQISASHKEEEEKSDKRHYYFHETNNQYFRRIALPEGIKTDKVDANFKDGTLKITMPMEDSKKTNAIAVK